MKLKTLVLALFVAVPALAAGVSAVSSDCGCSICFPGCGCGCSH